MAESLRDQLAANYEKIVTSAEPEAVAPEPAATPSGGEGLPPESKIAEPKEDKTGRLHGDGGKFVAKDKEPAAAPAKPGTATTPPAAGTQPQGAAAAPAKPRPQRPSSWKKDYWAHWDKLTGGQALSPEEAAALAEYMGERETQYQHGVATYKNEWDRARPIMEAMAPYMPLLEQHGIAPQAWITNLGAAHRELAMGSPQQKLARFQWLAQQYGLPINALVDEAARNQYLSSSPQQAAVQPAQTGLTVEEARRLFQQEFTATQSQHDVTRFIAENKEKYPFIEDPKFKETMAVQLESGLATDLQSALDAALRHPRHSEFWQQVQEQDRAREAEAKAKAEAQRVAQAKGKAVSVRSATPSATPAEKPKDRRSLLAENYDQIMGGSRV